MSNEPKPANANPVAPAAVAAGAEAKPVAVATGPASSSATAPSNAAAPVVATAAVAPANPPAQQGAAAAPADPKPSAQASSPPTAPAWTPPKPLAHDEAFALLKAQFPVEREARDRWDLTVVCPADQLRALCLFLRSEPRLRVDMLLDVVGVDYLSFPNHREARFAVIYAFKSLATNQRVKVKVWVDEDQPRVPTLFDLYRIANWMEREVWDQFGIVFEGHPNLKRLLNHHEFVGHPLRKDYPCQKRQKLSVNDPMVDQLAARLRENGYTVLDDRGVESSERFAARPGDIDGRGDHGMNDPDLQSAADGGQQVGGKRGVL